MRAGQSKGFGFVPAETTSFICWANSSEQEEGDSLTEGSADGGLDGEVREQVMWWSRK